MTARWRLDFARELLPFVCVAGRPVEVVPSPPEAAGAGSGSVFVDVRCGGTIMGVRRGGGGH